MRFTHRNMLCCKIFLNSQNKKVDFTKQDKGNYIKISPNFLVNTTNLC